jgi:hypothetical protein
MKKVVVLGGIASRSRGLAWFNDVRVDAQRESSLLPACQSHFVNRAQFCS